MEVLWYFGWNFGPGCFALKCGCFGKDLGTRKLDFGKSLERLKIGECYFEWDWWYFGKDLERLKTGECYFEWD